MAYCRLVVSEDGTRHTLVRHGGQQPEGRCFHCDARALHQCDGPGRFEGKTCDRWLCPRCLTPGKAGIDYCREHAPVAVAP